jgi:hypothetical protein
MSERGRCVQPAGGRAVIGGKDRRASLPATRASGGMARLGAPPLLGESDQHVAPSAPSRHEMSPLRQGPKLIRGDRKAVELARRHRYVARREHSGLTRGTDDSTFRIVSTAAPPHANSVGRPHGEGPKNLWLITGVGVLGQDLGRRLAGRVSKPTLLDRASLPERNALRSRRQRLMMLG